MSENKKAFNIISVINFIIGVMTLLLLLCLIVLVVLLWINDKPYGYANLLHFTIRRIVATGMVVVSVPVCLLSFRTVLRNNGRFEVKLFFLSFLLLFFIPFIPMAQTQWISSQLLRLQKIAPSAQTIRPTVKDHGRIVYYITEGKVPFKDSGWVYVITHSSHDDNAGFRAIGDISLAMDSHGDFFYSLDHVCGTRVINTQSKEGILNLENFIALGSWKRLMDGKIQERSERVYCNISPTNPPPRGAEGGSGSESSNPAD